MELKNHSFYNCGNKLTDKCKQQSADLLAMLDIIKYNKLKIM